MGARLLLATLSLAALLYGSQSQDEAGCAAVQTYASANLVCRFPADCCSRLLCPISAGLGGDLAEIDLTINPCSNPTTLDILVTSGGSVLFNMTGISTSQNIPVQFGNGVLDDTIDLFFNSSMDSVTIGLSAFGLQILPPLTIPIDSTGCVGGSMSLPPACLATPPPGVATQPGSPPVSDGTCQALLQIAGGGNIASVVNPNQCQVNSACTTVSCNYLGLFPFTLTLLTCNDPPGIMFVAYNDSGSVVFNETVTDSRSIQVDPVGNIIVNVNHPCGQSAIIAEVILSTSVSNATVLPATVIPIDRSDCTNVAPTITPCMVAPTSFNGVCDAVQSGIESSASTCTTNHPDCTTTNCDLSGFNIPASFSYMILPCTAVPSVRVVVVNDGMMILDQVLSESQVQTISVGPTNISVRFVIQQDVPLYRNIGVGVNLVSSDPPIDVPIFPLTQIPLDRCACSNITCPTDSGSPSPRTDGPNPSASTDGPGIGNPGANQGGNTNPPNSSGNNDSRIIAPAVIAAILFVALLAVIVVAIILYVVLSRKHSADLKSLEHANVSYKNLHASNEYTLSTE